LRNLRSKKLVHETRYDRIINGVELASIVEKIRRGSSDMCTRKAKDGSSFYGNVKGGSERKPKKDTNRERYIAGVWKQLAEED